MESDESSQSDEDEKMDSDDAKQVSFAPDVEVRVYESLPVTTSSKKIHRSKDSKIDGIKARLGSRDVEISVASLHNVKKAVLMKPAKSPVSTVSRLSKMKSDLMFMSQVTSVHSRLDVKNRSSTKQLTSRIKNFQLDSKTKTDSSVFNRLGKN